MSTQDTTLAERWWGRTPGLVVVGIVVMTLAVAGLSRQVFAGAEEEKPVRRITLGEPTVTLPEDESDLKPTWLPTDPTDLPKEVALPTETMELLKEVFSDLKAGLIVPEPAPLPTEWRHSRRPVMFEPMVESKPAVAVVLDEPQRNASVIHVPPRPRPATGEVKLPGLPDIRVQLVGDEMPVLQPVVLTPQPADIAFKPAVVRADSPPTTAAKVDKAVIQASAHGCANCGRRGGLAPSDYFGSGRCSSCGSGNCVPGRMPCYPCESNTILGGFFCDLYECICCPDPCYEPKWVPLADAAFFVDGARPVSQMRIGWESGSNLRFPDRSEFFWARADGNGRGPKPVAPFLGEQRVRYNDLTMYTETAIGGFSTFTELPYRSMDPTQAPHASGFGDMSIGTKSLLFDCELLMITFQFRTYIPIGNSSKGLGNGHTSLEPSLLFALKLSQNTYLQGQLSEWIPLGGDPAYQGSIFHSHFSLNHVLCRIMPDVPLIATFEVNTWSFQDGAYTDPVQGAFQQSSGETYVSLGPGLRLFICDRVDFGVGTAFAITEGHFATTVVRSMFRVRF